MGQHPEHGAIAGEKQHAAHQQIAQMNSPGNHYVAGDDKRHQHRAGNVGVGKMPRLEARQEQSRRRHPADFIGGDDQEQRGAQQGAAPQISGVNVQCAFNPALHP